MTQRLLAGVVVLPAVLLLVACSSRSTDAQPARTPSITTQTASEPAAQPDKLTGPAPADQKVDELTGFISPTGNVACVIDHSWGRCDIVDHDWSPPARPAGCELDYGGGIHITPGAPAEFICAGDTVFGSDDVLSYGESITAGVLRCESADSGITCRDTKTGHGFSIARQAYQLF
jgi:hypothetical protein